MSYYSRNFTGPVLLMVCMLSFFSCNTRTAIPFPENASELPDPVSRPFQLSAPKSIKWITVSPDSIKPAVTIPLNVQQLPASPFFVNDFKPFKQPVTSRKLDWENIPDSAINLDTIPVLPFRLQKSILPKPEIVRIGIPKILPNSSSGILQMSEEEGLPGPTVTASVTDRSGMIWFATNKGLCKYSGENLLTYNFLNRPSEGNGFAISHMALDAKGRIWLSTFGDGIYVVDAENGILLHDQSKLSLLDIDVDHDGIIWAASASVGFYRIDEQRQTIQYVQFKGFQNLPGRALVMMEDRSNNMWIGSSRQLMVMDPSRKKIRQLNEKQGIAGLFNFELREDRLGNIWSGSFARGIYAISLKNNTITSISADHGFPYKGVSFEEDDKGRIWVVGNDSVFVINEARTAFKAIVTKATTLTYFKGTSLMDKQGNLWVGTLDKGIVVIDTKGPLAEHLNTTNGLVDNNVWGLLEDNKGFIWIGTNRGINIYDPAKNTIRTIHPEKLAASRDVKAFKQLDADNILVGTIPGFAIINTANNTATQYGKEQGLKTVIFRSLKDSAGNIWMASNPKLEVFNMASHTLKEIDTSGGLLSTVNWELIDDHQGNYWLASDSGMVVINPASNTVRYLREKEGLIHNVVQVVKLSKRNEIWIGTAMGISVVDLNKHTITNISAKEGLVPQDIYDFVDQGVAMFAGSSNGVIKISKDSNWHFTNYGKREGFPFNDYNQMTAISTKNGQSWWGITPMLTIHTQLPENDTIRPVAHITRINVMDESPGFTNYASFKKILAAEDTLWDETRTKFYQSNTLPKDSGFLVGSGITWDSTTGPYHLPVGLVLPHDKNSLNFSFGNNDIRGRDEIAYRYILEGADTKWSEPIWRPFSRNYYNLPAGAYTIKVATKGFNGTWSDAAELSFSIRPPWWLTWWAYLLYVAGISAVVWTIVQYRSRWLQQENRLLEEKVVQRTAQLNQSIEELKSTQSQLVQSEKMASLGELTAGIAHEIQNPLNFVNNFSDVNTELIAEMKDELEKGNIEDAKAIAGDIAENERKINHHGKRADTIVKGMLQHSRTSNGIKEPTDINILADEYFRLAYHGLRAKDKSFNAAMKTDFDETIGLVNVIPQDIGRVILNLITNAFYAANEKFSTGSAVRDLPAETSPKEVPTVTVSTRKTPSAVEIIVKDNGNGIPQKVMDKIFQPFFTTKPAGQGTGLGLSLSYDIIKAHGGELKVDSKAGEYASFIIRLPLV